MGGQFGYSGKPNEYDNEKQKKSLQGNVNGNGSKRQQEKDADLIIEENTIYEIDRECFERLKKLRKRRE